MRRARSACSGYNFLGTQALSPSEDVGRKDRTSTYIQSGLRRAATCHHQTKDEIESQELSMTTLLLSSPNIPITPQGIMGTQPLPTWELCSQVLAECPALSRCSITSVQLNSGKGREGEREGGRERGSPVRQPWHYIHHHNCFKFIILHISPFLNNLQTTFTEPC